MTRSIKEIGTLIKRDQWSWISRWWMKFMLSSRILCTNETRTNDGCIMQNVRSAFGFAYLPHMAYTKKATAYILDCSPSMGVTMPNHNRTVYQEAKDMIVSKLEDRVSFSFCKSQHCHLQTLTTDSRRKENWSDKCYLGRHRRCIYRILGMGQQWFTRVI